MRLHTVNIRLLAIMVLILSALPNASAEGAVVDFLRSTGKIYSVVAGIIIIFAGIIAFLWRIDKKLSKLENHLKDE